MKKWTKVLLTAGMLSAVLCGSALAADFTVTGSSGYDNTNDDYLKITEAGTYDITKMSPSTDNYIVIGSSIEDEVILNLSNINIDSGSKSAIVSTGDADVTLNILDGGSLASTNYLGTVVVEGNLTVKSTDDSTLTVVNTTTNSQDENRQSAGIFVGANHMSAASTVTLTIQDITINASSSLTDGVTSYSAPLWSTGDMVIDNATITATATTATSGTTAVGILTLGDLTVRNGSVLKSVTATNSAGGNSFGMSAGYVNNGIYSKITITDTQIGTISGGMLGMYSTDGIEINGATVLDGSTGNIEGTYAGMMSLSTVTITDSTLGDVNGIVATAVSITDDSTLGEVAGGISATNGGVTITGSTVGDITVSSTSTESDAYGIFASVAVTLEDATVGNIEVNASVKGANGIYAITNVSITNSSTIGAIDVYASGSATGISGGTAVNLTTATVGEIDARSSNNNAYGIYAYDALEITDCTFAWIVSSAYGLYAASIDIIDTTFVVINANNAGDDALSTTTGDMTFTNTDLGFVAGMIGSESDITFDNTSLSMLGMAVAEGGTITEVNIASASGLNMTDVQDLSDTLIADIQSNLAEGIVPTLDAFDLQTAYALDLALETMGVYSTYDNAEDIVNMYDTCFVLKLEGISDVVADDDDGPRTTASEYDVTVEDSKNGDTEANKDIAKAYALITITTDPDAGYTVDEVIVTDEDGNELTVTDNGDGTYSYRQPVGESFIEVTYTEGGEVVEDVTGSPFLDLSTDSDAFEAIMALYENGIIYGMTDTTFGGDLPITRGMITTMLHRIVGTPSVFAEGFTDVADGQWYTAGVLWADSEGIVAGYEDGTFRPTQEITNQEMCVILMNFAISCGVEVDESLSADDVADWSATAVAWAMELGMFEGEATDVVTRELACEMIFAVLEYLADVL